MCIALLEVSTTTLASTFNRSRILAGTYLFAVANSGPIRYALQPGRPSSLRCGVTWLPNFSFSLSQNKQHVALASLLSLTITHGL